MLLPRTAAIEAADGRIVCYDVNTNTNTSYNPEDEKIALKSGPGEIARYRQRIEAETSVLT